MQVTFTNNTGAPVYVSAIYMTIAANSAVTTHRSSAQLDAEQGLKQLIAAGTITLTFSSETGDTAPVAPSATLKNYSNATRPAPNTVPIYSAIWNTDDNAVNWTDRVNWYDSAGTIT